MLKADQSKKMTLKGLKVLGKSEDSNPLGDLALLEGTWSNTPNLEGHGWNMIALPFISKEPRFANLDYRLLVNQYNETLEFSLVSNAVPNRGIDLDDKANTDQTVSVLQYEQTVTQIASDDFPASDKSGKGEQFVIHHEPGLFIHMLDQETSGLNYARLGSVPHGDSVLALGRSLVEPGAPIIPNISGLPIGVTDQLGDPYLDPYQHFHQNLFEGVFDPTIPNELLKASNSSVKIKKTTLLDFDSALETGGVTNIPFVVKQANATQMKAQFWIQELDETDASGKPKLRLQYSQIVFLEFFPRNDGEPGLIRWPHVSINTLEKV